MPYGVSEHMVETYGELIFDLSLNKQVRRGDPIRLLDHAAWLEQREATGLTDPEIAGKTGLAIEQVTFIRNITERRVFRLNQYRKLFRLGSGLRYREGRYQDPEEKFIISDDAVALRQAMHFTPSEVKKYIEAGDWNDEVLGDLLATIDPDKSAIVVPERGTSFGELRKSADCLAAGLREQGVARGDVVAAYLPVGENLIVSYLATSELGAVFMPLDSSRGGLEIAEFLLRVKASAIICEATQDLLAEIQLLQQELVHLKLVIAVGDVPAGAMSYNELAKTEPSARLPYEKVAADPILLTAETNDQAEPLIGILTHQNLVASSRQLLPLLSFSPGDQIDLTNLPADAKCLLLIHTILAAGAAVSLGSEEGSHRVVGREGDWIEIGNVKLWGLNETLIALIGEAGQEIVKAVEGIEIRIFGADGSVQEDGGTGELQLRGPSLFAGYLADQKTNSMVRTADGWFRTSLTATVKMQSDGTSGYVIA